jgi:hypothetical protein
MPNQTARQQARKTALDAQARMRAKRAEQDRRRSVLAVQVVTALAERDALLAACDRRAGQALTGLTDEEGLSLREAVDWCGSERLTAREATRLRQVARATSGRMPALGAVAGAGGTEAVR